MTIFFRAAILSLSLVFLLSLAHNSTGQTTAFTYQGDLKFSGQPANGNFDFEFALFDAATAGSQIGSIQTVTNVAVADGVFSVNLDFGSQFPGATRFLEIRVRMAGGGGFTTLTPRQPITSTPYSVKSVSADSAANATNAATATNALSLGGVAANQYVLTGDARLTDARTPTAGSPNYIQNTNTQQASSNFNISGNGTAGGTLSGNTVNTVTQYNIGGNRLLSTSADNLFVGVGAGAANTSGNFNAFGGGLAGTANTTGSNNSFFGLSSGVGNTNGFSNSFFGRSAGDTNTSGANNAFFGTYAGTSNLTGSFNSYFGAYANPGAGNLANATAIGYRARVNQSNSLVLGSINGINGATADTNVGIGTTTPAERLHVVGNTLLTGNLTLSGALNATLPSGSPSYVQNSTIQQASANFNISGDGAAGGTLSGNIVSAATQFNIGTRSILRSHESLSVFVGTAAGPPTPNSTAVNTYVGFASGSENTTSTYSTFVGANTGRLRNGGSNNSFFGYSAGYDESNGNNLTLIGSGTRASVDINNATAIGSGARVSQSNSLVLGDVGTRVGIGTTAPTELLDIAVNGGNIRFGSGGCVTSTTVAIGLNGPFTNCTNYTLRGTVDDVYINRPVGGSVIFREGNNSTQFAINPGGTLDVRVLGVAGATTLCRNASDEISTCSSSLRYKKNVVPFAPGLSFIRQLQPIAYEWKADGMKDVGFGAEDVAKIDPRFVTYNDKGEVEGIKYDRMSAAFVNAFREQQAQIDSQKTQIEQLLEANRLQQAQIEALTKLFCSANPAAGICREKP